MDEQDPTVPSPGAEVPVTEAPAAPVKVSGPRRDAFVLVGVILAVSLMIGTAVMMSRRNPGPAAPGSDLKGDVKGSTAPDFELQSTDGKVVKLADLRGKAVLLNFWA